MADYRKIKEYRINLEEMVAFSVHPSSKRDNGYHDRIILYPKTGPTKSFEIYYYIGKDDKLFEEAVQMLDDVFDVKTEEISKILP